MVQPPESTPESTTGLRARLHVEQRKLAAVRELGRALGANLDLDHVLSTLVDKVPELLDAERATLYLLEDDPDSAGGKCLVSKVVRGGLWVDEIRLGLGEGIAGTVAQTGEPLNIPDAHCDLRFNPEVDRRTGFLTRSILCVPVPDHSGRITGVMQALNRRGGGPFDRDDEALLGTMAAYVGVSLENSKLYRSLVQQNSALLQTQHDLRQRIGELDLLYQIEQEASAALDLHELLARLSRRAVQLLDGQAGVVALRLPSGALDVTLLSPGGVKQARLEPGQGLLSWVVQHRQSVISNDVASDARASGRLQELLGAQVEQAVVVPFDHAEAAAVDEDNDEALGAMAVINRCDRCRDRPGARGDRQGDDKTGARALGFGQDDLKLLTLLAGHAARAIVLSRTRTLRIREGNLASIGRMLAGVMHDLRTPMTIVLGYAQLMASTEEAEERERFVRMIKKQFNLMQSMTGEVMAFARGDSKLLLRRVIMTRFVEELREQLDQELTPAGVKLTIDASYLGVAYFDELKLLRLIHNLARNAAQAMPDGGEFHIGISDSAQPSAAPFSDSAQPSAAPFSDSAQPSAAPSIATEAPADQRGGAARRELVFAFRDTGSGLPEEVQAHLFEAFTSARKDGGTGLGLAIVKKIVDDHKGRISVSTRSGEGTTFTVAIPLSRE